MKAVQTFTPEYLKECRKMTREQIARFLDDFRLLHAGKGGTAKSQLISMKVPQPLLASFKKQCELVGIPYQTQIKKLMTEWLRNRGTLD